MGDLGYLDDEGRIWFCGRKAHRVETSDGRMFSVQCEAVFNQHKDVKRSALIGIGKRGEQVPAIVIEPEESVTRSKLESELLDLAQKSDKTRNIKHVFFDPSFPVDKRHNAKIHREELADRFRTRLT